MGRRFLVKAGFLIVVTVLVVTTSVVELMMNANDPRAVFIHTQNETIPDLAFKLSSVPLALASYIKFGTQKFAVLPATTDNIEHVLRNAEFVVIGTHGIDGMIYSDDYTLIGPTNSQNPDMRSIYFGSCYFGSRRKAWEAMFPNAKVNGHETETYKSTGWLYLVFRSWVDLFTTSFD